MAGVYVLHRQQERAPLLENPGVATLRSAGAGAGVEVAINYGDPSYCARVDLAPKSEPDPAAPFPLNHSEGWLGQPLTERLPTPPKGPSYRIEALNDPVFWHGRPTRTLQ
jgi:hypothetical protein